MSVESRRIIFAGPEILEALADFCVKAERRMPDSKVKQIQYERDGPIGVILEFEEENVPKASFYKNEVAAALIMYCNKRGIPVARRAKKSLEITRDSVALHLVID